MRQRLAPEVRMVADFGLVSQPLAAFDRRKPVDYTLWGAQVASERAEYRGVQLPRPRASLTVCRRVRRPKLGAAQT